MLEVDTFPLHGRIIAWLLYKTPFIRSIMRRIRPSPFGKLAFEVVEDPRNKNLLMKGKDVPAKD